MNLASEIPTEGTLQKRASAHVKMEDALALLDSTGDSNAAMHLDHAIMSLGLRSDAIVKDNIATLS